MAAEKIYPYEIKNVYDDIQVGPNKYRFREGFKEISQKIYNMEVRPKDVFVLSFPKSGTTWTLELVWLLTNNLDYETAANMSLFQRAPFLEVTHFFRSPKILERFQSLEEKYPDVKMYLQEFVNYAEGIVTAPSPRIIKSHLPLSLLPPSLLDTAKVIYVAREPRDVAVSYYYHYKMLQFYNYKEDFKTFWNSFIRDEVDWAPYGANVKEAWEKRHHPNLLFLFYEELSKDLPAMVRRVAQFLGKPVTEEQVMRLADHLHFDNFKKNQSVNYDELKAFGVLDSKQNFVRKGKVGGWRDYFDEEMMQQADRWMANNLEGINFHRPTVNE